jgi:hypothetical protein
MIAALQAAEKLNFICHSERSEESLLVQVQFTERFFGEKRASE